MTVNNEFKNQNHTNDSFNISININYNIIVDNNIKGIDTNIIEATKQAIFYTDCYFAKLQHYNRYIKNNDVFIFNVKKISENSWEVDFKEKNQTKSYDTNGYSFAIVKKQNSGKYVGDIPHSSTNIGISF